MRERAAASTRAHILQAAAEVFASNGYPLTTINQIAAHAEVGVNTVYTVFGTKAKLLAALINDAFDNPTIAGTASAVQDAKTGPAVIRELARGARVSAEHGYAIYVVGSQNSPADPHIATAMDVALKKVRHRVGRAVERLIDLNVLSPGITLERGTDILYFFVGPPAWTSLVDIGWSFEEACAFLTEAASRALLRRGRIPSP